MVEAIKLQIYKKLFKKSTMIIIATIYIISVIASRRIYDETIKKVKEQEGNVPSIAINVVSLAFVLICPIILIMQTLKFLKRLITPQKP
jgi:ascorbate-specific PTS system EIIC-type component UlaA